MRDPGLRLPDTMLFAIDTWIPNQVWNDIKLLPAIPHIVTLNLVQSPYLVGNWINYNPVLIRSISCLTVGIKPF